MILFVILAIYLFSSANSHTNSFEDNLDWEDCSWLNPDNIYYKNIKCVDVEVPFLYSTDSLSASKESTAGTFSYRITKFVPSKFLQDKEYTCAHLWWLAGGSNAGPILIAYFGMENLENTEYIWYFPDHRGLGYSYPMECPNSDTSGMQTCVQTLMDTHGEEIYFSMTVDNAARDIGYILEQYFTQVLIVSEDSSENPKNRGENGITGHERVPLYMGGSSYGSLWLDRLLFLCPNLDIVKGVIYDSFHHPSFNLVYYDREQGDTALTYLSLCELSIDCIQYFGGKGVKWHFYDFYENVDNHEHYCVFNVSENFFYGWNSEKFKKFFLNFQRSSVNHNQHFLVPAFLYRMNRCNGEDIKVFANVVKDLNEQRNEMRADVPFTSNIFMSFLINLSENTLSPEMDTVPDIKTLIEWQKYALFTESHSLNFARAHSFVSEFLYSPDLETWKKLSFSSHPRLVLHGNLDYSMSFQRSSSLVMERPEWQFIVFPLGGYTPMGTILDGDDCAWQVLRMFLSNPKKKIEDILCLDEYPVQFDWAANTSVMY